mmetsp:Transcript_18514/g.22679  ORF Transcript_18514/g.22679 Transcript_18514/m.22679 type:complete len:249 (-) Transcript_18514:716-1462(-)
MSVSFKLLAIILSLHSQGMQLLERLLHKVQINTPVETTPKKVAAQIDFQQTNRHFTIGTQHNIPTDQWHIRTQIQMSLLHQFQNPFNIGESISGDGYIPIGVVGGPVSGSPRTFPRQNLVWTQTIPVGIGRTTTNHSRRRIDIEEYGIVIGRRTLPPRTKDTAQSLDSGSVGCRDGLHIEAARAARDHPERAQRCPFREQTAHPLAVLDPVLDDPIPPITGVVIEVNAHPTLLVLVLHNDARRCFQKR